MLIHSEITEKIIKGYYQVYNTLGYGFLEQVYEKAMFLELGKMGFYVERQKKIKVYYDGNQVGLYFADLIVNNCVIIEIKAAEALHQQHEYQLINYLKATEIEVGLLFNFGKNPEFRRKIFTNNR